MTPPGAPASAAPFSEAGQNIALLAAFVAGTRDIILYVGERPHATQIGTLPGGKLGDANNTPLQNIAETLNPFWAMLREVCEEAGPDVRPRHVQHAFDFSFPYAMGRRRTVHMFAGTISAEDVAKLTPAPDTQTGFFTRYNLDELQADPYKNTPPISPMNLELLTILQRDGVTGKTYASNTPYMSLGQFNKRISRQRRLQPA